MLGTAKKKEIEGLIKRGTFKIILRSEIVARNGC